jgi:ABC-type branched-subunit amino acid transport system substrate-binding protein
MLSTLVVSGLLATSCTTVPNRDVLTAGAPSPAGGSSPSTTTVASRVSGRLLCPPGVGQGSPGVSAHEINIGAISTLSGPIAADFANFVPGMQAYFDMVNAQGGVEGRKIVLKDNLDDAGIPSQFTALAHELIDGNRDFAVGVSSFFFNPSYFVQTCTPTYGYNVTGNWAGPPNLFAAGGSVQAYANLVPAVSYLMRKLNLRSIALLSYDVSSSSAACEETARLLQSNGYKVSYTDFGLSPINADLTPDVQRIKAAGSDFILSCMDVNGNISLLQDLREYGVSHVTELWLNGNDQSVLDHYTKLMQGVYFFIGHVPFTAATKFPGAYPGLEEYLKAMETYSPAVVDDELAVDGWMSAALLVDGIRAAGGDLTQANVVAQTNRFTEFTADGLTTPVDWETGHSVGADYTCFAIIQVRGDAFEPVFTRGSQVFTCVDENVKHPHRIPDPPGTPGG